MFKVETLDAQIGSFRLEDINLSVAEGECYAVLGPSGAGKSTLLNAILGTVPIKSGRILLDNEDISHLPIESRHLGYVPQDLGLFPHLSVIDNLIYSARARKVPSEDFTPLLDRLVEITGIERLLKRRIGTLSGGERQRVALVRALTANPRLVLLDEPFTALNETLRKELWWLVKELQRERGLSALLITHDLTEAYFLAKKLTVLIDGRQKQSGDKEIIYRHPANLEVANFLGIKNLFPAIVVGRSGESIEAYCECLGRRFHLPGDMPIGAAIYIGIRAEDILLRDATHPPRSDDYVLSGVVYLVDLNSNILMHFYSQDLPSAIEIIASKQVALRFGIIKDRSPVNVALRPSAMFWFPK